MEHTDAVDESIVIATESPDDAVPVGVYPLPPKVGDDGIGETWLIVCVDLLNVKVTLVLV
jgi:hypothetical protein